MLMMLISALHNLSRSVAVALLAVTSGRLVVFFVGGEMLLYFLLKIVRRDFWYYPRLTGFWKLLTAIFERILVKIIADFTSSLFPRHPFGMGGLAFSINMVWAQAFPFVALQFFEDGDTERKGTITLFLVDRCHVAVVEHRVLFHHRFGLHHNILQHNDGATVRVRSFPLER